MEMLRRKQNCKGCEIMKLKLILLELILITMTIITTVLAMYFYGDLAGMIQFYSSLFVIVSYKIYIGEEKGKEVKE